MANYTPNMNLKKPLTGEYYDVVAEYNNSMDIIDAEVGGVKTSLAQNATDLKDVMSSDKVSKYIDITDVDMTAPLNTTLLEMKGRGIKYAYVDKNANLRLENPLAQNNVFLMGNAKIGKAHESNTFYNIVDRFNFLQGNINRNYCKFTQLKAAIAAARPINITIFGDSISTNGDYLGVNGTITGLEKGPDNITEGDSYTSSLIDGLAQVFDDKTLNFYNRAIGGTRLADWDTNQTFNATLKTWIEHIKDTAPDVLVIAFGMNHNSFEFAKTFAFTIKIITDYINANFVIKPDLIFVTTPRASYVPTFAWGSFEEQASRQLTANVFRNVAAQYKAYLMDVNKISNIKRAGTDWLNPTFVEMDYQQYLSGNYIMSGNDYVLDSTGKELLINKQMKDFVLKFTVVFAGYTLSTGNNLTIQYNKTTKNNQVLLYPLYSAGASRVINYANIADFANWGASGLTKNVNLAAELPTLSLRFEKRGNIFEIHEETSGGSATRLILRDKLNTWDVPGTIRLLNNTVSGMTITLANFRVFEPSYNNYLPTLTEEEAWGQFVNADYTLKTPFGGNGVNHPSSHGIREMYLPAVQELIRDIAEVYRNS